jgi:hypothetical protein
MTWRDNDLVWVEEDDRNQVAGRVILTSKTGASLGLFLDGMFRGHQQTLVTLRDTQGVYRSVIDGLPVRLRRRIPGTRAGR